MDKNWWLNFLFTAINYTSFWVETSRFDDIWCLYHLFNFNLIFVSTESPTQHPGNNSRDVLNVTESKKLLDTSMESGKQLFSVVGRLHCPTFFSPLFSFRISIISSGVQLRHLEWYQRRECYRGTNQTINRYQLCFEILVKFSCILMKCYIMFCFTLQPFFLQTWTVTPSMAAETLMIRPWKVVKNKQKQNNCI